jgi:hypothetical protein
MPCIICNALKRELSREGETEAGATLDQRARLIPATAEQSPQDALENVILVSRKHQAHLATELYAHQEDVNADELDSLPGVRKASVLHFIK